MAILDYTPIVGKTQLQSLILTLYSDSRTIFREYIQNACDSIYDAVSAGILKSENEGHVAVNINSYARYITIRDNGTGIPGDRAVPTLMDIFHSSKDGVNTAGQYGIGRLSGGGYCNQLIFRTSCVGEEIETELTIDVLLLKSISSPNLIACPLFFGRTPFTRTHSFSTSCLTCERVKSVFSQIIRSSLPSLSVLKVSSIIILKLLSAKPALQAKTS